MVPLPLFKLAALFVRQVSKYGANHIKAQAHEHPRFRQMAARYGQAIHQLNMRLSVALLRNVEAEMRAKEKAEAPTVKTKEQVEKEEAKKAKNEGDTPKEKPTVISVWRRKFRPLPEAKAVDLFADVIGDAFILAVGIALVVYEYWRSSQKPDANLERIKDLTLRLEELKKREDEREQAEEQQRQKVQILEEALRNLRDPRTKKPLVPTLQLEPSPVA